jgi:SAM-dependent methyltransferase
VTGIDLAPDMLERAQDKVNRNGWRHVTLEQGDALNLKFPDDTFDYVMAFHVVSVVPDPVRMMAEARRVCRPGGVITIINHFRSPHPTIARLMRAIDPITRRIGWTTLKLPTCSTVAARRARVEPRRARCSRSSSRATRGGAGGGVDARRASRSAGGHASSVTRCVGGANGMMPRRTRRSASRWPRVQPPLVQPQVSWSRRKAPAR